MSRPSRVSPALLCALVPSLAAQEVHEVARLPVGLTSFGAARLGGAIHVAGGHVGRAHAHSRENLSERHLRLDLDAPAAAWTELAPDRAVQGTALVAHDGRLYRIGGLTAHNAPGEQEALESLASVACFDPARGTWEELTALPEPRSSHDALVVGERVYVVGGWTLGSGEEQWLRTAWTARLGERPLRWEPLAAPCGARRAAALARHGENLVLVGGMTPEGTTSSVELLPLAPTSGDELPAWRAVAELPGAGFGAAACELGGRCFATSGEGVLFELAQDTSSWRKRARLVAPRFFHRLLPFDEKHLIAIGGAERAGHTTTCEVLAVDGSESFQRLAIDLPPEGGVQRGAVIAEPDGLLWFGGNRRVDAHRFASADFATSAWRLPWSDLVVHALPPLPAGLQSALAFGEQRGRELYLLGGFGYRAGRARSVSECHRYTQTSAGWQLAETSELPQPRTQAVLHEHGGARWILGGVDFDEQRGEDAAWQPRLEVLRVTNGERGLAIEDTGWRLPRPRRACASFLLGSRVFLVGGLGARFDAVGEVDVLDLESGAWSIAAPPAVTRLGAHAVKLGAVAYLAGGTAAGAGEARSLERYSAEHGWNTVLSELPFSTRNQVLLTRGSALLFARIEPGDTPRLVIHALAPTDAPTSTAFGRH